MMRPNSPLTIFLLFLLTQLTSATTTFFGLTINTPAPIVKFDSTLLIPNTTTNALFSKPPNVQAIWPGLQPEPEAVLLQHVVTNPGHGVGEWYQFPYWCCNPAENLREPDRIFPGDLLSVQYRWNPFSQTWFDNWVVQPGSLGQATGGGIITDGKFDSVYAKNGFNPMTLASLMIELQGDATWDWGEVVWTNVVIEAQTANTDWCVGNWRILPQPASLKWTRTIPQATWNAQRNTTTCYIGEIVLLGHY